MPYSKEIDRKWQERWAKSGLYKFDKDAADKKLYCLEMFSYPSAAKLHVGHWYNYSLADCYARFKRMRGFEVFQPMGFDAFGLPAENYAIKTGVHPQDSTLKNIDAMEKQLREMGGAFDWDYELITCMPDYYKWTQWLFIKLFERGLAYRKLAPVNWCPNCKTVLANEQVIDGSCERCGTEVSKENLTQWFFKITDYADELLDFLPKLNWPEKTKKMQVNWIGRSEGAMIDFAIARGAGCAAADCAPSAAASTSAAPSANSAVSADKLSVFTTRADTLFGVTYVVIAPEHPLVDSLVVPAEREAVAAYRDEAKKRSEIDRMSTAREKTGTPTGSFAINPATGEAVPIWVADYVLAGYGTGCVMAVPAHDERDYEFAKKYDLPIRRVVKAAKADESDELPYVNDGLMTDSGRFSGTPCAEGRLAVVDMLREKDAGSLKVNYRLRDWLVSRQRYWGAPIPIVHCPDCGTVAVPERDLPVLLPYDAEFAPDGESPLARHAAFMNVACPKCGAPAKRDPDTLDTFVCSSWYYLRFFDNKNEKEPFNSDLADVMMPVDVYVGGAEHATMHLLYARFICKALRDMGFLICDEPFTRLVHQGMVLGADGQKMSKSLGNTVTPDDYIDKFGADVFRMYLAFGFSFTEGGPWNDDGIRAVARFIARMERFAQSLKEKSSNGDIAGRRGKAAAELEFVRNNSIKQATHDIERFQFNTAISRAMELLNALYKYEADVGAETGSAPGAEPRDALLVKNAFADLTRLVAPFAPHFSEEIWESLGAREQSSVFAKGGWPAYDEKALARDVVEMAVQVNGVLRYKITIEKDASDKEIESVALADARLPAFLAGAPVKKVIVVRGRLVSVVK